MTIKTLPLERLRRAFGERCKMVSDRDKCHGDGSRDVSIVSLEPALWHVPLAHDMAAF